jgi:hypothetical protein
VAVAEKRAGTRRFRSVGTRQSGWGTVVRVLDRSSGDIRGVYFRLGRWRYFANDDVVPRRVSAVARRAAAS